MSRAVLDTYPSGATIYCLFDSFAGSTGAPSTISGFAVGDIQIYKNGSTTQRSSTAGFTLLDTDGIDFDSLTGINGFSVDLSDNTDSGFYAAGSQYTIVISTITIDSQTMSFVAGSFRIVAAEGTSGTPAVDATRINNVAATSVTTISANVGTTQPVNFTGTGASALAKSDMVDVAGSAVSTSSAQIGVNVVNAGATAWNSGAIKTTSFTAGAIDAAAIAADAIGASELATDAVTEIVSAVWKDTTAGDFTTANSVGKSLMNGVALGTGLTVNDITTKTGYSLSSSQTFNVTGNITGNLSGSVGSVTGAVGSVTGLTASNLDATISSRASASSLATAQADLDTLTGVDGVTLATLQANYAPSKVGDQMDLVDAPNATAVTAIQNGLATPTNITAGTITTVTNLTNAPTAGDLTATMKASVTTAATAATPTVTAGTVSDKTGYALTSVYDFAKGTTAMTESYAANGAAPTPVQAIMGIHQYLMDFAIASTNYTVKKLDNSTTAFTVALNDDASPTAASRT